ncbi:MAG: hypothetical protein RSD12_02185 [Akkermansia sp.]
MKLLQMTALLYLKILASQVIFVFVVLLKNKKHHTVSLLDKRLADFSQGHFEIIDKICMGEKLTR